MYRPAFLAPASLLLFTAVLLSGCGMGVSSGGGASSAAVQGRIMGGQQPVADATVQLYAAANSGYGSASAGLLSAAVISDANGGFTISNLYTCPSATTQVYILARGGNPGLSGNVDNAALTLMAALGDCGNLSSSTNIILNEVTTVAAAWALAPFMTAYDHVGTSPANAVGLRNAFGMAANLASTARGQSPGDVAASSTIPAAELNTLANVLASCVNTPGGVANDGSACGNLFHFTTVGAKVPSNTADAALAMALNPANNVAAIYALTPALAPFQPTLTASPNDWTVAVNFSIGNRSTSGFAFDATGNLWVVSPDALYELSPQGAPLGSYASMAGNGVAIDATGNIWITTGNSLVEMPSTLAAPTVHSAANPSGTPNNGLAIDGLGNAWYTCDSCTAVYKVNAAGNYVGGYNVSGVVHSTNVSIDTSENVWLGNYDYAKVNVLMSGSVTPTQMVCGACGNAGFVANDGAGDAWIVGYDLTRLTPGGSYANYDSPAGGLFSPAAVAIDGAGNAWVTNAVGISSNTAGSLSEFTNAGSAVSPGLGYVSTTLATPLSVAVDGSGSVWLRNTGNATVTAFVGAGVPVVTPLALGVKNNTLGSKP